MIIDINDAPLEYVIEDCLIRSKKEQDELRGKICRGNLSADEYQYFCGKLHGWEDSDKNVKESYKNSFKSVEKDIKERKFHEQQQKLN